jgi:integrase
MSIRLPSHLHRNRYGIFGFRIVVPRDLRSWFRCTEFRVTLKTGETQVAKQLAAHLTVLTCERFNRLRRMSADARLSAAAQILDEIDTERQRLGRRMLADEGAFSPQAERAVITQMIEAMPEGALQSFGRALLQLWDREEAIEAKKRALAKRALECSPLDARDTDSIFCDLYEEAGKLKEEQIALRAEVEDHRSLMRELYAEQERDAALKNAAANFSAEREKLADFASQIITRTTQNGATSSPHAVHPLPSIRSAEIPLSQAMAEYCEVQVASKQWTEKTAEENRAILDLWIRIVGDREIATYSFTQHREYRGTLLKLPPNINKIARYRGRSIPEILAFGDKPAAPNTINKAMTRTAAFFKWAGGNGYSTFNPGSGMNIRKPKRANEERKAFDVNDLRKLFDTPEYQKGAHRRPYMFWSPLIALYTGARVNEIAQLHIADFRQEDGIPVISIDDQGEEKRVKTSAAKRLIPVHPELIRLGLLEYVDALRKKRLPRLFMELKHRRDGFGQTVSKWFARYRERCGVVAEGKVFHSFRHTVIDYLKQAGVPKEKIAALVGHEDESVTFGRYGKDFQPRVMVEVVSKLPADVTASIPPFRLRRKT